MSFKLKFMALTAALTVFGLFVTSIYWKGLSTGKSNCRTQYVQTALVETQNSIKDKAHAKKIVRESDDIDQLLRDLGIMRR